MDEYVRDFDFYAAAIRSGVPRLQAKRKGRLYLQTTHVLAEVAKRVDAMLPEEIVTPQRVLAGLMREAGSGVFSKDRIAALKSAHDVLKDVKQQKRRDEDDEAVRKQRKRGGGVMMVPGMPALSDWEKAAREMQSKLKEKVRE